MLAGYVSYVTFLERDVRACFLIEPVPPEGDIAMSNPIIHAWGVLKRGDEHYDKPFER
jgi:hypothetical protein